MPGLNGRTGKRGPIGSSGFTGLPGPRGPSGRIGTPGRQGYAGRPGVDGAPGASPSGRPGPAGTPGPPGQPSKNAGHHLVYHSQNDRTPGCPTGFNLLWKGYSLMYTVGNGQARSQDLGKSGSCIKKFSPVPFLICSLRAGGCKFGQKQDISVWLQGRPGTSTAPVPNTNIVPYVSRCTVCEGQNRPIAIHSQDTAVPNCPAGHESLWTGYSFLMSVGRSKSGTGQQLSSAGSCLPYFRPSPGIECQGGLGACTFRADRYSFWLRKVLPNFNYDGKFEQRMGMAQAQINVSRCRVCMKRRKP